MTTTDEQSRLDHYNYMRKRYEADKIDILKRCKTSREVYESLSSEIEQWHWETNDDDLTIDDEPYCIGWEIEVHTQLLSDLKEYTSIVKVDGDIPEELQYITQFWDHDSNIDDDEE